MPSYNPTRAKAINQPPPAPLRHQPSWNRSGFRTGGAVTPGPREDVDNLVSRLVELDRRCTGWRAWARYSQAKRAISGLCGWHAPAGLYDQLTYDRAVARYVQGVGL